MVYLPWNDNCVDIRNKCFLVVSGTLCEFTDRLFMKDVCEPEIIMNDDLPFVAESFVTLIATPRLQSSLTSSFLGAS
jgi:hypothetical protein